MGNIAPATTPPTPPVTRLHIRLLGEFAVTLDHVTCTGFESLKVRALLAILASNPDMAHTRAQLAGLLWGELPDSAAKQNLRQALFNLRQAIGDTQTDPPFLLISRHDLQINPAANVLCDMAQLWRELKTTNGAGMLNLYRGKFLSNLFIDDSAAFEEWAEIQREALHQRVMSAIDKLAENALKSHTPEAALDLAQHQLTLDPWHEAAHRNIMRAQAALGHSTDALAQFAKCSAILQAELGVPPSAETLALYHHIRAAHQAAKQVESNKWQRQNADTAPPAFQFQLPTPPTPLIGRERELTEAMALLADPACRLLSLIGPGGVGKTRLALALAQPNGDDKNTMLFVPLASVPKPSDPNNKQAAEYAIAQAIAHTLNLVFNDETTTRTQPIHALAAALNGRRLTVILDNIEHLIAGTGLLSSLLAALPQLKIIVTSRERLNVRDEWAFGLSGLNIPAESIASQDLAKYSATQLFLQAAHRAQGANYTSPTDATHIVRICRLVDGLPLGIELAAAWTRMLPPADIVHEIGRDLDFLSTLNQDLPDRHRSMNAVFDYSWNMLTPIEQRIFCQLGLFAQSFTREAAAQIAGASLLRLTGLVDKSLVQRTGEQRYQLHQLLRRFAEAKLREKPDLHRACCQRHSHFYADYLAARTSDLIGSPRQKLALDEVAAELDNIRMAWANAIENGDVAAISKLLAGTFYFYESRSWFREGADTFAKAIAALDHLPAAPNPFTQQKTLARLCSRYAWLLNRLGAIEQTTPLLDRAMTLFERVQMPEGAAFVWNVRADIAYSCGDYDLAQAHYQHAEQGYRQVVYRPGLARVLVGLGNVWAARETDPFENSTRYYADGLYEARAVQNRVEEARALVNLGTIALTQHNNARARELFEQAITVCQDIGDRRVLSIALTNLGDVYNRDGDLTKARLMFEHSLRLKREIGHQRGVAFSLTSLGDVLWKLGERNAAKQSYRDALQLAMSIHAQPVALTTLLDLSDIAQAEGNLALAAHILAFVLQHPALEQFQRMAAQTRFDQLTTALATATLSQIQQHARSQTLDHIAALAMTI